MYCKHLSEVYNIAIGSDPTLTHPGGGDKDYPNGFCRTERESLLRVSLDYTRVEFRLPDTATKSARAAQGGEGGSRATCKQWKVRAW